MFGLAQRKSAFELLALRACVDECAQGNSVGGTNHIRCLCLGQPKGEQYQSQLRQVSQLHHKDTIISKVSCSDAAILCLTARGDIFLLHEYTCKKIGSRWDTCLVHVWLLRLCCCFVWLSVCCCGCALSWLTNCLSVLEFLEKWKKPMLVCVGLHVQMCTALYKIQTYRMRCMQIHTHTSTAATLPVQAFAELWGRGKGWGRELFFLLHASFY